MNRDKKARRRPEHEWLPASDASKKHYMRWLAGYLANGGDIQHWRSRPFERRDMKVVKRDLTIKPISGSKSVDFLVERGTNVKVSDQVRARIYYFDDYSVDNGKPEMFSDIDMRELESFINIFHT